MPAWQEGKDSNPHLTVLETVVLPLNYRPMVPQIGFEPTRHMASDPKSDAYASFATGAYMVGMVGFEPTRPYGQRILSPHCLPIPAHSHLAELIGLEPIRALQRYSRFSKPVPYRLGLKLLIFWWARLDLNQRCILRGGFTVRCPHL